MANASVFLTHSYTQNLKTELKNYDIVITATGKKNIWTLGDFQPHQLVLDVGINNSEPGEAVKGDIDVSVETSGITEFSGYVSTVPGGVGPLTVISLLENTFLAAQQ